MRRMTWPFRRKQETPSKDATLFLLRHAWIDARRAGATKQETAHEVVGAEQAWRLVEQLDKLPGEMP